MDTGATAIFIMEGTSVDNKRVATKPLTINLPDGTKIKSTHCCDVTIPGLPKILTGHIVPSLSIASLIGVRVLCDAGCTVTFRKKHCDIIYNGMTILKRLKDPNTDLWTIPISASPKTPSRTCEPTQPDTANHVARSCICPLHQHAGKQSEICTPISGTQKSPLSSKQRKKVS